MSVTLHRAFDVCRDPLKSLQTAKDLGIQTILTSGQKDSCMEGADLYGSFKREQGGIQIQAGGGVTPENLETLFCQTGIRAWHMSAKTGIESRMKYRNPDVIWELQISANIYCSDIRSKGASGSRYSKAAVGKSDHKTGRKKKRQE